MPIALDPAERFEYVISTDRSKPKEDQPTFIFHYPTVRERRQMIALFEQADKANTVDETFDLTLNAVKIILVDWRNVKDRNGQPVPFNPTELDNVASDADMQEFRELLPRDMGTSEIEKKVSALRLPSASAKSASDATAGA